MAFTTWNIYVGSVPAEIFTFYSTNESAYLEFILDGEIGFSLYHTERFKSNGAKLAAGTLKFSRIKTDD